MEDKKSGKKRGVDKSESQKKFLIFLAENLNPLVTAPRPSCTRKRKISRFFMRAKMKSKLNADTEYKLDPRLVVVGKMEETGNESRYVQVLTRGRSEDKNFGDYFFKSCIPA